MDRPCGGKLFPHFVISHSNTHRDGGKCDFRWPTTTRTSSDASSLLVTSNELTDPTSRSYHALFHYTFVYIGRPIPLEIVEYYPQLFIGRVHHPSTVLQLYDASTYSRKFYFRA